MALDNNVLSLKGVGVQTAKKLESIGILSIRDALDYWPRAYEDYSQTTAIKDMRPGMVSIKAKLSRISSRRARRGLHMTEALAEDKTGAVHIVWFNQPYRAEALKAGKQYYIYGTFAASGQRLSIVNPSIEEAGKNESGGKIVAVYPERKGIPSKTIAAAVSAALPAAKLLPETLPPWLVEKAGLIPRSAAIEKLHAPITQEELESATRRLAFEEIFELQLSSQLIKRDLAQDTAPSIPFDEKTATTFAGRLPFKLTDDQRKVIWQIYKDMQTTSPMNRLVEGDVGSGKTVVAAMAAVMAMKAGYQVLYMAPTELLARQHAATFSQLFSHTKWADGIGLLVGSVKKTAKDALHAKIAAGECRLVVGTHALIQDKVAAANAGLVIIDEQHRFGVEQRQKLRKIGGLFPHVLCMTATPIPRSLALTLYGELDLSIIAAKPAGRQLTETKVINFGARDSLYKQIDKVLSEGRQAFIVAPLISDSKVLEVKAAETLHKELADGLLKHRRLGLLHGSMKAEEKDAVMQAFVTGKLDALVSTTVIEVGVDVPNAAVMIIEGAERFGLAQLHQLRGRIGRGAHQAYCYLVPSQGIGMTKRLRAIESTLDGFKLAEMDLSLRGPGSIYGVRQSGVLDLRIANVSDRKTVAAAKELAIEFIENGDDLLKYPELNARVAHFRSLQTLN